MNYMAKNTHVYLMQDDGTGGKRTVYPVTDVNAIIGLGNSKGDLISRIDDIDKRLKALETKINYH